MSTSSPAPAPKYQYPVYDDNPNSPNQPKCQRCGHEIGWSRVGWVNDQNEKRMRDGKPPIVIKYCKNCSFDRKQIRE